MKTRGPAWIRPSRSRPGGSAGARAHLTAAVLASSILHVGLGTLLANLPVERPARPASGPAGAIPLRVLNREVVAPRESATAPSPSSTQPHHDAVRPERGRRAEDSRRRVSSNVRKADAMGPLAAAASTTVPGDETGSRKQGLSEETRTGLEGAPRRADLAADSTGSVAPVPAVARTREAAVRDARREYALLVRRRIESARTYPSEALSRSLEGQVVLAVRVGTKGHVEEVRLANSSGIPSLDRAALRLARGLCDLPPPPGGPLEVRVPVRYSLR